MLLPAPSPPGLSDRHMTPLAWFQTHALFLKWNSRHCNFILYLLYSNLSCAKPHTVGTAKPRSPFSLRSGLRHSAHRFANTSLPPSPPLLQPIRGQSRGTSDDFAAYHGNKFTISFAAIFPWNGQNYPLLPPYFSTPFCPRFLPTLAALFCILYTLADPWKQRHG